MLAGKCKAVLEQTLILLDVGAPAQKGQLPQINSQPVGNTKHHSSPVYSTDE